MGGNAYYGDADGDGHYGDVEVTWACALPSGHGFEPTDCDDEADDVYPGAPEGCDFIDNDCDGRLSTQEQDGDGDGFAACEECDDRDAAVFPGAEELCNTIDDDCDGAVDEDGAWYEDSDGDGFGDAAGAPVIAACDDPPDERVDNPYDCDDANPAIHPDAQELCDDGDVDEDCDGQSDDDDDSVSTSGMGRFYPDADEDGYGEEGSRDTRRCDLATGWSETRDDCDDAEPRANPGEVEVCGDGIDNDCDEAAAGCGPYGTLTIAQSDGSPRGDSYYDAFGTSLAAVGDVNGDGTDDLAVGAPSASRTGASNNEGLVYLYTTPVSGSGTASDGAPVILHGANSYYDQAGTAVAGAGDVNGDGYADLLISAPNEYSGAVPSVHVVTGPVSGVFDLADAAHTWTGDEGLGNAVVGLGDLNDDGHDDVAFAWIEDDDRWSYGYTYVQYGPVSSFSRSYDVRIRGTRAGSRLGRVLDGGGDLNGDGIPDLLIASGSEYVTSSFQGAVRVFFGPDPSSSAADADLTVIATRGSGSANMGTGAAFAGDTDGDGQDDLVVAANNSGEAYLLLGPLSGSVDVATVGAAATITDVNADGWLAPVDAADVDADGLSDLLICSPRDGDAAIFLGPVSGTFALADGDGVLTGSFESIARAGDVNGDGADDIVLADPGYYRDYGRIAFWFGGLGL